MRQGLPEITAHEKAWVFALLDHHGWEVATDETEASMRGDYFCRECMYNGGYRSSDHLLVEAWKIITPKRYRAVAVYRDGHTHVVQVNLSAKRKEFNQVIPLGVDLVGRALKGWS